MATNKQTTKLLAKWCEPNAALTEQGPYLSARNKHTQSKVEATFHIFGNFFWTAFQRQERIELNWENHDTQHTVHTLLPGCIFIHTSWLYIHIYFLVVYSYILPGCIFIHTSWLYIHTYFPVVYSYILPGCIFAWYCGIYVPSLFPVWNREEKSRIWFWRSHRNIAPLLFPIRLELQNLFSTRYCNYEQTNFSFLDFLLGSSSKCE